MQTFFSFFILGVLLSFAYTGLSMAPWVPTKKKDLEYFLSILSLKQGEKFLEIGSGDARVCSAVAKKYPCNSSFGIELSPVMFIFGYMRKVFGGNKNLELKFADAFRQDISDYQHIYVFGMPDKLQTKIVPKFLSEAKKGAKLYSYAFSIPKEFRKNVISYGEENQFKIHILEKK